MKLKIKKLDPNAIIPNYAHEGDSGMDLYSIEDVVIPAGESVKVKTGLALEVPFGYEAQIRPKSGLAAKSKMTVLNTPGTIDSNYRGEVQVILINLGKSGEYKVEAGKKIAQMVIAPVVIAEIEEVDELSDTVRGEGGFGSTGLSALSEEKLIKDGDEDCGCTPSAGCSI
jgi:dUTP pyrophosphatase